MSEHPVLPSVLLSGSHAQFLEELTDKEFWNYATELAYAVSASPSRPEEYLECNCEAIGHRRGWLALVDLREVVSPPHQFTRLPGSPTWMHGIMAWRDEIIPVVDLGAYLTNNMAQPRVDGMVLVAHYKDLIVGLFVGGVGSMTTFELEHMVPLEHTPANDAALCTRTRKAIKGVYADALVLDIPVILADIVEHLRMTVSL
jgi:chemotaxis signal transduction protein